jgi:hypothetical protein
MDIKVSVEQVGVWTRYRFERGKPDESDFEVTEKGHTMRVTFDSVMRAEYDDDKASLGDSAALSKHQDVVLEKLQHVRWLNG